MQLSPREFVRFLDGRSGQIQTLAFVPGEFTARIGALSCDLLIERSYAEKLKNKHSLRYEHWGMIQVAINHGYAILQRRDSRNTELLFAYVDDAVFQANFLLAIKQARGGEEIWLKSFYRCQPGRVQRLLRDGELLREHA